MAVTYPLLGLMDIGIQELPEGFYLFQNQEYSTDRAGIIYGKDLARPIWKATWTTKPLRNDIAIAFEARLNSLDGVIGYFMGHDPRRHNPASDPTGAVSDVGCEIHSVGVNNKSMRISGKPAGFVITAGDYIAINYTANGDVYRSLHQALETVTVDGLGVSPLFEVRPHFPPGVDTEDTVVMNGASATFIMDIDSMTITPMGPMHTVISWRGVQTYEPIAD